ncbi:hypothetical protein [Bacillus velezensis]|nr:hypothetical protein [Bacillus velezensis]
MIEYHWPDCDYKKLDLDIRPAACCSLHCGRGTKIEGKKEI